MKNNGSAFYDLLFSNSTWYFPPLKIFRISETILKNGESSVAIAKVENNGITRFTIKLYLNSTDCRLFVNLIRPSKPPQ